MISWLTDKLYYPLAKFPNSSLTTFDGIVQFYLILSVAAGVIAWLLYYWVVNTEFVGKKRWWILFGMIMAAAVLICIQYETTSKISSGEIPYTNPPPSNLDLFLSNSFFFGISILMFVVMSLIPQFRGHRLKRIPF